MEFTAPQLALLVDAVPAGDAWVHEQKFDGYRIEAVRSRAGVRLFTRRGNDWTDTFPTIAEAVAKVSAKSFVLDGEIAVLRPDGVTDFQGLQQALNTRSPDLVYFAFDLLEQAGKDLRDQPLLARKARLEKLLAKAPAVLRYSEHVVGRGEELFAEACKRGLEGIICKRADAPYTSGRGKKWVKVKCRRRQELVVGGFTEPEGARTGLGALLVGYYDGTELRYAGKVGTGFTAASLGALFGELAPLERKTSAFTPAPPRAQTGPRAHWVEPKLVVEIQFGEWTRDGRLRHPSFQGVRRDKRPKDVVREAAQ
ncbi:MAG TPA: non-homologous end-joining DNA ligase [Kofleriaceae bacterium]|nr:non-homologous end-joining DNA ligase [Kofleriaceae bacterium]